MEEIKSVAKNCFDLTNEFREKNGIPKLDWDESLYSIALPHSKYEVEHGQATYEGLSKI